MRNPNCTACGLCKVAKTVCLWGSGPRDARLVVIGQNPGREEDAAGSPFIGASGKLLRSLLSETGVEPGDVYITNAVKCWTPNNRKPDLAEIKACRVYLEQELAALNPCVIVVLGDTALQSLLSKKGITTARKAFHLWRGVPVVATFHPAYALRSPQFVGDLRSDLMRAVTFVNPQPPPDRSWVWGNWSTPSLDMNAPLWTYDIETNGKDLDDPDLKILLLGIFDGTTCQVYNAENLQVGLLRLLEGTRRGIKIVGHNAIGFDAEYLFKYCGISEYLNSHDTMILAHVIDENSPLGLEQLACTHLGVRPWKAQVTWDWGVLSDEHLQQAADYNAEDTINTWHLANKLFEKAQDQGLDRCYDIMRKGTVVFEHHINRNGIALDMPGLRKLHAELLTENLELALRFEQLVGHPVNINSPQQVAKALFSTLGLTPAKYTPAGAPSTDEESLKELMLNRLWVPGDSVKNALEAFHKARKSGKLASMLAGYANHAVELPEGYWRIYPHYFSWRTTTHRSTADKGFQQWPHDPRVRGLLTAAPGHVLLSADYGQLQMRIAAQISRSPQLRRLFVEKIDPHTFMAAKITGKEMCDVTKEERYVAKPVNFALLFGAEPYTLRVQALKDYNLVLSENQARVYHDIFHGAYKLEPWYAQVARELQATGAIRSPLGGIRHLPNIFARDSVQRNEALRKAINAPVQDLEVMIAYLALWLAYLSNLKIVAFLHDALYVEAKESEAKQAADQLKYIMEEQVPATLVSEYQYRLEVPLEVDVDTKTCYT